MNTFFLPAKTRFCHIYTRKTFSISIHGFRWHITVLIATMTMSWLIRGGEGEEGYNCSLHGWSHAFSRTWQTANFEISERDRQVEAGGSKDAKTIAGSFYPTLLHQNTQLNTPFSQKINCMNQLYAVKADGIEKYLLQNKYFIILPTCPKNTSIWCCYNSKGFGKRVILSPVKRPSRENCCTRSLSVSRRLSELSTSR